MAGRPRRRRAACALATALVLFATTAAAQTPGGSTPDDTGGTAPAHHSRARGGSKAAPARAGMPEVRMAPEPWPRLDPGAVLCRTPEDLQGHLRAVAARLDGGGSPAEPAGCRIIRARTAVAVLAREAQGRTEVRLSDGAAEIGWTDAFLPDKGGPPGNGVTH